jgi:hypothetical protein
VPEFLEVKPRPARLSNAWREDSRHRFSQWLMWKSEQRGRIPLQNRRTYQLLDAARVKSHLHGRANGLTSEWTTRPLNWLLKNGYESRIPDVWRIAVDLAGTADKVTSTHVRQALQQWKKDTLGNRGVRNAIKASRAKILRGRALAEVRALTDLALESADAQTELRALLDDIEELIVSKAPSKPDLKVVG